MRRGDVVVGVTPGDYGKPRPAVVVQADLFNETHASVVICPITSHLVDAPLFRLPLTPTPDNGLAHESQIMVDKITAVRRDKIKQVIGHLRPRQMEDMDKALRLWLGLGGR